MRVDREATIAGHPIKRVRDFLRRVNSGRWMAEEIAEHFKIESANDLIAELINQGLLKRDTSFPCDDEFYALGPNAQRLINVRFVKRIDRQKADRLVAGLLERARHVNADNYYLFSVAEMRAFGSYIDPTQLDLGDVDIALSLERRLLDGEDIEGFMKREQKRASESGRRFSNILQMLDYAEHEVRRFLKARSPYLSLHDMSDMERIGAANVILFPAGSSK